MKSTDHRPLTHRRTNPTITDPQTRLCLKDSAV